MSQRFTSAFFAGNREKLRQLFTGTAPIVVTANGLLQRGGDSTFPFAQDASFWYLTGIEDPDITLVMDRGKEFLIVPVRNATRETFDGAVDEAALRQLSGIKTVVDEVEGWRLLHNRLKRAKHVASLAAAPAYIDGYGFYSNPARGHLAQKLKDYKADVEMLDLSPHLARLRSIKQPPEIVALQAAIDTTLATIKEVTTPAKLAKYRHEYEIEAAITAGFRRRGSLGHAFAPIVASGQRACVLHNVANNGPLDAAELLIMDVGAEVDHYAADISRTISLSSGLSSASRRQQAVYDAVAEVQQYALSLLQPGALLKVNEQAIEQFMGEKLRALGLIKTIDHDQVRQYFPHATSHFLGLNVHDVGDYSLPLEAGMVLTVEPGIYIPAEAIGVRIEDDVLITADGYRSLS